ncbi:hypothetical protein [Chitinophaga tropicalis]|uniref:Uncharacterized protein n=1 Tax=Chitinophaga tropicalis TaxID=2683588 RepID=A0A7K1U272_9BACT|nr:hypothetical protein [Chitinophaga tropicalis]MVT08474.1 hypothetical protein [Chitinophaga tropicalis]
MKTHQETVEAIAVRLQSIRALNSIVLSKGNRVINPHQFIWNSKRTRQTPVPVAFDLSQKTPFELEVHLAAENGALGSQYQLQALADNGAVLFSGKGAKNDSTITVQAQASPKAFAQLHNNALHWQLTSGKDEVIGLGTTWVQLFWIDLANQPADAFKRGIPVEALEKLYESAPQVHRFPGDEISELVKKANKLYDVGSIVNMIFNYVPPRYDIWQGAPHFVNLSNGWNNITLYYNAYISAHNNNPSSILNCYDAAAVLQYNLQYYGYSVKYCFMQPFGYMRLTNLIGRGQCNNPFYGATGGPAVISSTSPSRTAFLNHAFVYLPSTGCISDACAGPHIGNETPAQYVNNATDSVYPNPPAVTRGTTANIGYYTGVTSIVNVFSAHQVPDLPHVAAFKKEVGFSEKSVKETGKRSIVGKWPSPAEYPAFHNKWTIYHDEIVPGEEEVVKLWMLKNGEHNIFMKIYVSSAGNELSYNRFLSTGGLSQGTAPAYERVEGIGHYAAISKDKRQPHLFWVADNVVVEISASDNSVDLNALAEWYYRWAIKNRTMDITAHLPHPRLQYSSLEPRKGDQLFISHSSEDNELLDFLIEDEGLRLVSAEDKILVFDVQKPVKKAMKVLVVDKDTLLVNSQSLKLNSKE